MRANDYILVSEAAAQLGMTAAAVRMAIDRGDGRGGQIRGQKFGGVWLVLRSDVDAYVKAPGKPRRTQIRKSGPPQPLTPEQRAKLTTAQRVRREREMAEK